MNKQISEIKVEGIKGYPAGDNAVNLVFKDSSGAGLYPNKINILVAPNGFGKSSLTIAISQLNNRAGRLDVKNDFLYLQNQDINPRIELTTTLRSQQNILVADLQQNQIGTEFDIFVINSLLKAKGKGSIHGRATGELRIEDIEVCKVPAKSTFNHSFSELKTKINTHAAGLVTILKAGFDEVLKSSADLRCLFSFYKEHSHTKTKRDSLLLQLADKKLSTSSLSFNASQNLILNNYTDDEARSVIALFIVLASDHTEAQIRKIIRYVEYQELKENLKNAVNDLKTFDQTLSIMETSERLVIKFPLASNISNGQRDILAFIGQLYKFYANFSGSKKNSAILVVDEVFDYLDDANLLAAHYFLVNFIDKIKALDKKVYLMLLTHLDPSHLIGYRFKKPKTFYLAGQPPKTSSQIIACINKRREIDARFSKYLHYDLEEDIDLTAEFQRLNLASTLAKRKDFIRFINEEFDNYLRRNSYCPISTAIYLRILIEEDVYKKLKNELREEFLNTYKTVDKLDFASEHGIAVDEVFYLLSPIYNDMAHKTSENLYYKLENNIIRQLISCLFG